MIKILLISQNTFNFKLIDKLSLRLGFRYKLLREPENVGELLSLEHFDLIISSTYFGETSCENLLIGLNEGTSRDIPVLVLSESDNFELKIQFYSLGVVDFVLYSNFIDTLEAYVTRLKYQNQLEEIMRNRSFAIIDDDHLENAKVKSLLSDMGVKDFETFESAEEILASNIPYDIYLVDLVLPKISGDRVVLELRKKYPFSVIIAISSVNHQRVISNVLNAGADDYIIKPLVDKDFKARLKANLRTFLLLDELKKNNSELLKMAQTDSLTGLYNRRYAFERLEQEHYRYERYSTDISVIMMDLDRFKDVNDQYGHIIGDEVLIAVSNILKNNIRKTDIAGRFGGEEFMLILPNSDLKHGINTAKKIQSILNDSEFTKHKLKLSASFGVAEGESNPLELLRKADKMLYKAKDHGRNCIEPVLEENIDPETKE